MTEQLTPEERAERVVKRQYLVVPLNEAAQAKAYEKTRAEIASAAATEIRLAAEAERERCIRIIRPMMTGADKATGEQLIEVIRGKDSDEHDGQDDRRED